MQIRPGPLVYALGMLAAILAADFSVAANDGAKSDTSIAFPRTREAFQALTRDQLESVFEAAERDRIPRAGVYEGKPLYFAGSTFGRIWSNILSFLIWNGKVFHSEDGVIYNRLSPFSLEAIKGDIRMGESRRDGKTSVIIDYSSTVVGSPDAGDEIRWMGGDVYLGQGFVRGEPGMFFYLIYKEPLDNS
ncbi:MAG: hypothetical protein P8Y73_12105 [Desulfuromonadales bacterium]|jgi:hypothetical protein